MLFHSFCGNTFYCISCPTSSNVDISRLDFSKGVFCQASIGLSVNLLIVVFRPEWLEIQISVWQYLKNKSIPWSYDIMLVTVYFCYNDRYIDDYFCYRHDIITWGCVESICGISWITTLAPKGWSYHPLMTIDHTNDHQVTTENFFSFLFR